MPQIKALSVDWHDEALRISAVLAGLPTSPPGLLSPARECPPLLPAIAKQIEDLQDLIALHLAYRLRMIHRLIPRRDGKPGMYIFLGRDPATTRQFYAGLATMGVKFESVDRSAIDAHARLGQILLDRWACDEWKRMVPLVVSAIGGVSASRTATQNARQPRPGRIDKNAELRKAAARTRRAEPEEQWKQILVRLQGDGTVRDWNSESITWVTKGGDLRVTPTGTFRNWIKK